MIMDKQEFIAKALVFLEAYAGKNREFLIEDVGEWAGANGLDDPYENRWWGGVTNRAKSQGIIVSSGTYRVSSKGKANPHPVALWYSAVYKK